MAMNFGLKNTSGISSNKPLLKPYGIYPVTFSGVETSEFAGKKDPSKKFKVMRVRFEGKEGYYTETVFFPETDKDMERMSFDNTDRDGKPYKSYMPSSYDRAMATVAQIAAVVNPEGWKKMQEVSDKFTSFADVVNALKKITDPMKGKFETNLKLTGRVSNGQLQPTLPNFVRINRDGEAYLADNFIGETLGFSPAEEAKRVAYQNAAPTSMPDSSNDVNDIDTTTEDVPAIDLDDLGL